VRRRQSRRVSARHFEVHDRTAGVASQPEQAPDQMLTQIGHGQSLIALLRQSRPQQVNVIGHEHIGRRRKSIPGASMQQDELPARMKRFAEPSSGAVFDSQRPMHEGITADTIRGPNGEDGLSSTRSRSRPQLSPRSPAVTSEDLSDTEVIVSAPLRRGRLRGCERERVASCEPDPLAHARGHENPPQWAV